MTDSPPAPFRASAANFRDDELRESADDNQLRFGLAELVAPGDGSQGQCPDAPGLASACPQI